MSASTVRRWADADSILARTLVGTALLSVVLAIGCFVCLNTLNSALLTTMLINVVAVTGLGVFMGNSGTLSFGHAGFMGLAAYASGIFTMDKVSRDAILPAFPGLFSGITLSFPLGIVVALTVVAAFAVVFGLAISRLPGDSAAIATLGVLVIVNVVLLNAKTLTNGAQPLYGVLLKVSWQGALVAAIVTVAVARLYRESSAGLQLRASREDEFAAQALGINVRARRLEAWVLSAMIAGLAGLLLGHFLGAFSPTQFYLTTTVTIVAMLIVGGANTVSGAVMGTLVVTAVLESLSSIETGADVGPVHLPQLLGLPTLGLSLVLIAIMYFRREGLFGRRELEASILRLTELGSLARIRAAKEDEEVVMEAEVRRG